MIHLSDYTLLKETTQVKVIKRGCYLQYNSLHFWRLSQRTELTKDAVMSLADRTDRLRPVEIAGEFDVSRNTVSGRLSTLVEKGLLRRHGKGAGVFYSR